MANSKITIKFLQIPQPNYTINFRELLLSQLFMERFRPQRLQSNQVTIPQIVQPITEPPVYNSNSAMNYRDAFNLDYNATNLFTVYAIPDVEDNLNGRGTVIIEANYPGAVFTYIADGLNVVAVTINNEVADNFDVESMQYQQSATPCSNVNLVVTTNQLATKIISPITINDNVNNPFTLELLRSEIYDLTIENEHGTTVSYSFRTPRILNASDFSHTVFNSPNGAILTITPPTALGSSGGLGPYPPTLIILQYSLDNTTWQNSNVFTGLESGDYNCYIRDQYGCSFSFDFSVNSTGIYTPNFYLSKSNSIRFAQRIVWGDAGNYKNDENSLSCEADVLLPYKEIQLFQTADIITTQFKSNYANRTVKVIRENGSEVVIPIEKKTENTGVKDKRDARKISLGNGKTGLYFISGNLYNYDTNQITGTYALNGNLPEWGIIGNYINIGVTWYYIENKYYDEDINAEVIVISDNYTGAPVNVIVGCIYNIFDYEVYEFTIDMVNYINEKIRVQLINQDNHFGTITHLSEEISVKVRHKEALDINYWNDDNNDVFYATGIRHRIRIPFFKVEGSVDENSDSHKTDTNVVLLDAQMYEADNFTFEPVTKEIWRKLMMALSHENVYINGVKYVKNGEFETDGPLDDTNLYQLKAQMIKSGNVYNTAGSSTISGNSSSVEIPGLIEGNDGFIAY